MATKILQGGTVIGFDDATQSIQVHRNSTVLVKGDRIAQIVSTTDGYDAPKDAETLYRTAGPNVTLAAYLGGWFSQYSNAAAHFTPDDVYISSLQGYVEGLYGGVTSYVDHAHNNWAPDVAEPGFKAAQDSGARVWWCYDVSHRDKFPLQEQWEALSRVANKAKSSSLVRPGIALDSLSAMFKDGPEHLEHTRQMIEKLDLAAITIHHLGSPWPDAGHSSPIQICNHGLHSSKRPVIFSHASFLRDDEMAELRAQDQFMSVTPESECHFGHGQVSGQKIMQQASLGLDTNWTFSGDMLFQARLWMQVVRKETYEATLRRGVLPKESPFTAEQGFLMATRQGGLALKRDDLGVLRAGAKADIVVFDGDAPNMLGWSDPVAAVMLHANPSNVEHVLVDGEFRKRDFKMLDSVLAQSEIRERFVEVARRIQPVAAIQPPLPEKVFGVGEMGDVEVITTIRST